MLRAIDIPVDHPACDGHFPGRPILPGVVLLDEVLAAVESVFGPTPGPATIRVAKFHATVAPGATLTVRLLAGQPSAARPAGEPLDLPADKPGGAPLGRPAGKPAAIDFTVDDGPRRVASGRLELPGTR